MRNSPPPPGTEAGAPSAFSLLHSPGAAYNLVRGELLLYLTYRIGLGKKENLLTLLFWTRNPACRQGITVQAAWSKLQHRQEEPSTFKETRECLNPCRIPSADTHIHPGALPSSTSPPMLWPGGCPWSRQKPQGYKSLLMEPPWKASVRRGRAGGGLSRLTKIITIIISSFQRIAIISVINNLNNSKAIRAVTTILVAVLPLPIVVMILPVARSLLGLGNLTGGSGLPKAPGQPYLFP